jgi:transposase InsO family protein
MIDQAVMELAPQLGVRAACQAVGAAQAGYYRRHRQSPAPPRPEPIAHRQRRQPRALSAAERQAILDVLHSDRFVDLAPAEVWAILLDEGVYLGSESTFYRLLRQAGEVRERRRQATHPAKVKPELVSNSPNMVWSWDITKLHGPAKWTYHYLYVILDIFSLLSRIRDNSEAQFKTLKYRPDFPGRFDSIQSARRHCRDFFGWYNDEHRHTGLGLHTPADVHYGLAEAVRDKRAGVLDAAYTAHPERFVHKPPQPPKIPETSWINRPNQPEKETQ